MACYHQVNRFLLHPVLIRHAFPSYLYPHNNKNLFPHYAQFIVFPTWLFSQAPKHHLHPHKLKVCHLPLPLVVIQCVFYPPSCWWVHILLLYPSWLLFSKARHNPSLRGVAPCQSYRHCSGLNNNHSVLSVSCLPASVGPLLIPGV